MNTAQAPARKTVSIVTVLAWDGTDLVRKRRQGDAKPVVHHGFHPSRHLEGEVLQERSEEEEKLHLGQGLAQTEPLA